MINHYKTFNLFIFIFVTSFLSLNLQAAKKVPHWGKAKHKCVSASQGLVFAKLKGVKIGKKKKTCESKKGYEAPHFSRYGATGKPNYCKTKPTGVYGYWKIKNDKNCEKTKKVREPYWGKVKHRCKGLGKGLITARLLGAKDSKKATFGLCNSAKAPSMRVGGKLRRPDSCKKNLIHVYGQWNTIDDKKCKPKIKKLRIGK